jgi:predicted naringenin-chalcone synthase
MSAATVAGRCRFAAGAVGAANTAAVAAVAGAAAAAAAAAPPPPPLLLLSCPGLKPTDIDILLTNSSIYCPTPSLASMVINMYGMREDVQAYHMGGMGCAMGVLGLNLARDMLIAHPGKICLFVSSEVITAAFYPGLRKEALVTNALFRVGGSAAILTNNPRWRSRSKYQLQRCLRVHTGANDRAYRSAAGGLGPAGAGRGGS